MDFMVKEMRHREWTRRLNKKLEGKPQAIKMIQRRTLSTALLVVDLIENIPFAKLSMTLYFYCQDVNMAKFTRLYESQIELAGANPEKFAFQLHKFYNNISNQIKKENLYSEYFEFCYRCERLRIENTNRNMVDNVIIAYMDLLIQTMEYLRPSKFELDKVVAGRKTTGELITIADPFPNIDIAANELNDLIDERTKKKKIITTFDVEEIYSRYGYDNISSVDDMEILSNMDRIQCSTISFMSPFINEYTFDILPKTPCTGFVLPFESFKTNIPSKDIKERLIRRRKTLPTNGVIVSFTDGNILFKKLLLKETFFDNKIFMLYRFSTSQGDLCGYYDTKEKFFHSVIVEYMAANILEDFSALVLYLYGCYTLEDKDYQIGRLPELFKLGGYVGIKATGILYGGRLKNVYDGSTQVTKDTGATQATQARGARKGNEDYETTTRAIQGMIRKLPNGQKASEKAQVLAASLGYELGVNETYVQSFMKQVFRLKRKEESNEE